MTKAASILIDGNGPAPKVAAVDVRPEAGEHPPVPMKLMVGGEILAEGTLVGVRRPRKEDDE